MMPTPKGMMMLSKLPAGIASRTVAAAAMMTDSTGRFVTRSETRKTAAKQAMLPENVFPFVKGMRGPRTMVPTRLAKPSPKARAKMASGCRRQRIQEQRKHGADRERYGAEHEAVTIFCPRRDERQVPHDGHGHATEARSFRECVEKGTAGQQGQGCRHIH